MHHLFVVFWFSGYEAPGDRNVIDYVTISSTGNAFDFGDLPEGRRTSSGASNNVTGLLAGGSTGGGTTDLSDVQKITISSLGNSSSFGNLDIPKQLTGGFQSSTRGLFSGDITLATSKTIEYFNFTTEVIPLTLVIYLLLVSI